MTTANIMLFKPSKLVRCCRFRKKIMFYKSWVYVLKYTMLWVSHPRIKGETNAFYYLSRIILWGLIKWKHFPRYWPFVRGIHRSQVNCPHKGQSRRAFMFSLICAWINCWVNNGEAGDLIRHRAHYDVILMLKTVTYLNVFLTLHF